MTTRHRPLRRLAVVTLLCAAQALPLPAPAAGNGSLHDWPMKLTDDAGRQVTLAQWAGRTAIVTMEYASCQVRCSITLAKLKQLQDAADRRGLSIDILVISLDPRNDTPAAWTEYRRSRELDRANWRFLTSAPADLPTLAGWLGVGYWYYGEHLMHDFRLLRIDANGKVVRLMETYDADPDRFLD